MTRSPPRASGRIGRHAAGIVSASFALAVALLLAPPAGARKFQMSGKWDLRRGDFYLPLRFAVTAWPASATMATPVSSFPNGPVLGPGGVVATGSAPPPLRIPRHPFRAPFMAFVPFTHSMLSPGSLVQITTNVGIDAPYAPATLAPGGGPGSFTWCPGDPACVAGGGMLSTDPPQGAGPRNGRIVYRAGPNQFGGTMQMLLSGRMLASHVYQNAPWLGVTHIIAAFKSEAQRTGGAYAATLMHYDPRVILTIPTMAPTKSMGIYYPGPVYSGYMYLPALITTPMGFKAGAFSTQTGFPF